MKKSQNLSKGSKFDTNGTAGSNSRKNAIQVKSNDHDLESRDEQEDQQVHLKKVKKSISGEKVRSKEVQISEKSSKAKKDLKNQFKQLRGYAAGKSFGNNVKVKVPDQTQEDEENLFINDEHPGFYYTSAFIPCFLKEPDLKDKNGKQSGELDYDPTTLYIPPDELKKCKPLMKQYWQFKSQHLDKLVAIKVWKFYYFYFNDAVAVHRVIDMKLVMWGKQTFTFFHESCMDKYAPRLLECGYQIAIVEQMEAVKSDEDSLIRRDVCQILTRGTAIDNHDLDYSSRFMLALFEYQFHFGLVFLDTTTHEVYLGEIEDRPQRSNLRTLLTRYKPVEIVLMKDYVTKNTLNIIHGLSTKPVITNIKGNEQKHVTDILEDLDSYFISKSHKRNFPGLLETIRLSLEIQLKEARNLKGTKLFEFEQTIPFYYTLQALRICAGFLESVLLAETVLSMGRYMPLDISIDKKSSLYLDNQALENLEVFDVPYLYKKGASYSLFGYMDKTVSGFGQRMFKRWLMSPFLDVESIKERQDAVEDLLKNWDFVQYYHEKLKRFPDLERIISRVYNLSNRRRLSAVYYEDFARNRLKDFLCFLKELKAVEQLVETFRSFVLSFQSKRLVELAWFKEIRNQGVRNEDTDEERKGIFPKIGEIIEEFENMVVIHEGLPIPRPGVCKENDRIMEQIENIKYDLNEYLKEQKKRFNSKELQYVHSKHRYELEIPEKLIEGKKRPKDFAVTSKRKGYLRIHSLEIEELVQKLTQLEQQFQAILIPFICEYFKKFYENNDCWQQVISCLGELDCLCTLAKLAQSMPASCRPDVLQTSTMLTFELIDFIHPMVASQKTDFIPNSLIVENGVKNFLITGPNMGGKSTFLRQVCLAVIMAQVGSFVPASSFRFNVIDRIFTRMGAKDNILEGKSTFFIEMEETYNILTDATKNSLVIIDELGRGTSTYDGLAVAYASLKYLVERVGCITLFSTHYHLLLEEFRLYKSIASYHMQSEFDEGKQEIKFLYKFIKGETLKSNGIIIAKMTNLPNSILERAKEKADSITNEKKNIEFKIELEKNFNKLINIIYCSEKEGFADTKRCISDLVDFLIL